MLDWIKGAMDGTPVDISPLAAEMILQALRPVVHEHYGIGEDVRHDTEDGANV